MSKTIDLIVLTLLPLILSLFAFFVWLSSLISFRKFFYFPWGDDRSTYPLSLLDLLIYNGVQAFFIVILFLVTIFIYGWVLKKLTICKTAKRGTHIAIAVSWLFFSFSAYSFAGFFCCPGLFPDVFNSLWWLTAPEFIAFAIFGEIYLMKKCRESRRFSN